MGENSLKRHSRYSKTAVTTRLFVTMSYSRIIFKPKLLWN